MLGLFYSLAFHMRWRLGAWPESIGEAGFPASLATHAHIAETYLEAFVLVSIFLWPIAFMLCMAVRPWRKFARFAGLYAFWFALCFGSMLLAPPQFLNWWMD
jgi:hypothetical protein